MNMSLERTPTKAVMSYGSESNLQQLKEKQAPADRWVQLRKKQKRTEEDQDSDSQNGQESTDQEICCSNTAMISNQLMAMQEQMTALTNLLTSMKKEQETRYQKMQEDMRDIKNQINEVRTTNSEIEKSVQLLSSKCEDLEKSKKEFREEANQNKNKINDLAQRSVYLEKCNKALEERVMKMEQRELELNIELVNVQTCEQENVMEIVGKIAKELNLNSEEVAKAHRMPGNSTKAPRPIIVTLQTSEARQNWLKCKKSAITNKSIFKNENTERIYINENITRHLRQLFWTAKTKLKDTYKYIWIQNSKILIKKSEEEKKIYQINFESDIENILQKEKPLNRE